MTIEQRLADDLKTAMKARESERVSCIRSVRAKMQETVNAKGFSGEVDDTLWQSVITSYAKMLKKGIEELAAGGARGEKLISQYTNEITYLEAFLPKLLDRDATQALVSQAIANSGANSSKDTGRVMGAIMKDHKSEVDAQVVRELVQAALA